jgi:hypothetical protein
MRKECIVHCETVKDNMRIVYIEERAEMYEGDCETGKGNMRIVHIRHVRRCMRDVYCETMKGNMRIVFIEKRADMYEGCV